ncbi:hypothetical protein F3Y22_tig00111095pilonHSYRG00061 [Hibiscus syriacus]|uniref:Uncharacterized protein n=1 Tax=Hibiscus syriacus TaxID=106335 RepID=A0A6A2Z1A6_HIBSY|nr:hypothetical protein F3Y22_tig00111095pilonHSYRG00061 [Hibiscus syriacus]
MGLHSGLRGYFSQPVVDAFDPRLLVCPPMSHVINFSGVKRVLGVRYLHTMSECVGYKCQTRVFEAK